MSIHDARMYAGVTNESVAVVGLWADCFFGRSLCARLSDFKQMEGEEMKKSIVFLCLLLTGCAGTTDLMQLPTGDIVNASTDRWGSWERVRKDEEKTKQEIAKAEKAKAETEKVKYAVRENVQVNISGDKELALYALKSANDNLAAANKILGDAVNALAGGGSVYKDLPSTPMPKGAFAETIESTGDAVSKLANSPVALVVGSGRAAKWILDAAEAGAPTQFNLERGDLNARGSFNDIEVRAGNESPVSVPVAAPETTITDNTDSTINE